MVDLMGEYRHKVDAKGRVSLPADFRRLLPTDLRVLKAPDAPCLYVFDDEGYNEWVALFFERDGGFDPRNLKHVNTRRALKALGKPAKVDASGRMNIPNDLLKAVEIGEKATIIGNTGYFEVWDEKRWDEESANIDLVSMLYGD